MLFYTWCDVCVEFTDSINVDADVDEVLTSVFKFIFSSQAATESILRCWSKHESIQDTEYELMLNVCNSITLRNRILLGFVCFGNLLVIKVGKFAI